jgi:hypothetical protein
MPQFLRTETCSIASISPFSRASSAAVCLSPCTKNAAGQKMIMAAVVATVSLVAWLSWAPAAAEERLPSATADGLEHVGSLRRRIRAVLPAWARARAVNGHLRAPADQAAYGWAECVAVAPEGEAVCCTRN